ncbi:hypothetical protein [Dactylosporangium sp. NPDC051541]|uniref:hypothetical protein n=1 Tax=Dactylosporangium sp. NPDC051541 TaxID=3363977 RepID=UPI0037A96E33
MSHITITLSTELVPAVLGEPFGPHLAVVPGVSLDCTGPTMQVFYHGDWSVTHVPSGQPLVQADRVDLARTVAASLAESGIDWSRPFLDLRADRAVRDTMDAICATLFPAGRSAAGC